MKNDFIPRRDADINSLELNFIDHLDRLAKKLGLDPEEIAETKRIISGHSDSFFEMISRRADSKAATERHNLKRKEALDEIRRISRVIKSSKKYNSAIGEALGIVGPEISNKDISVLKPELRARINADVVSILYRKQRTDGINIYSKRGDETKFTFLAVNSRAPYNDSRPKLVKTNPEQREYYAYFLDIDEETGQRSDVLRVTIP